MNLPQLIKKKCEKYDLLPPDKHFVVGVSGGADSIALLRVFRALEIPVTIAHLNHSLRGAESDADEAFVREIAAETGLPMVAKTVDVKALAEKTGQSIEMAARQARHDFFREFDDSIIALAHHADDQVETFFLKLARGAGTEGLSGMPYFQKLEGLELIRPMLDIPREEILQWLKENNFKWREDSTNSDEAFLRNKVRHTILPILESELNPNIRETVLRTMEILRAENEWMDEMAETGTSLAAKRRSIRKWLFDEGAEEVGFDAVERILKGMEKAEGSSIAELNESQRVVIEYGNPRFEDDHFQTSDISWNLSVSDSVGWLRDDSKIGDSSAEASICAQKLAGRAIDVRMVRAGDRISPLGMKGSRKLQDILTDLKTPKAQRNRVPVVVCEGEIVWVPGYRIAQGWQVEGSNGKSVHLKLEQNRTE